MEISNLIGFFGSSKLAAATGLAIFIFLIGTLFYFQRYFQQKKKKLLFVAIISLIFLIGTSYYGFVKYKVYTYFEIPKIKKTNDEIPPVLDVE